MQPLLAHPHSWNIVKRLNHCWRVLGTGVGFILFALGVLMLSLVFGIGVRLLPISRQRKSQWLLASIRLTAKYFLIQSQVFGLFNLSITGASLRGLKGHMIVANHPSLVDALFILANVDNACCIVKEPLWRNPITRSLVKLAGYIPNDSYQLVKDASKALASGKNLIIFPEGTRNESDHQLLFKRGAANIALKAQCPITPVVLEIYPRTLQKGGKWFQVPEHRFDVSLCVYQPLQWHKFVDHSKPITLQARHLTTGLRAFYAEQVSSFRSHSERS